jgi:hypothetical protein
MSIANIIAALALAVSVFALIVSSLTARRQNRLQASLVAIEEERHGEELKARQHALVKANITRVRNQHWRLEVTNEGPAVARSVTLEVSSATDAKPPQLLGPDPFPADPPAPAISFPRLGSVSRQGCPRASACTVCGTSTRPR